MGVYTSDENGVLKKYAGATRINQTKGQSTTSTMSQKAITDELNKKADKVSGATTNNFASLDANGNLKDSGTSKASLEATMNTKIATTSSMTITSVNSTYFSAGQIIVTKNNNVVNVRIVGLKPKIAIGTWQWIGWDAYSALPVGYRPAKQVCFVLSFDASPEYAIMAGKIQTSGVVNVNTNGYTKALTAGNDRGLYGSVTYIVE